MSTTQLAARRTLQSEDVRMDYGMHDWLLLKV